MSSRLTGQEARDRPLEIRLGSPVITSDGEEIGTTTRVLLQPDTNLVSHIVVTVPGAEEKRYALPLWVVERDGEDALMLETTADDTLKFPLYLPKRRPRHNVEAQEAPVPHEPGEYPALFPEDGSLPARSVALGDQVGVACSRGPAGRLAGLLTDDYTAELVTLLVRLDAPHDMVVAVPMAWARAVSQHEIALECDPGDLHALPPYESEAA